MRQLPEWLSEQNDDGMGDLHRTRRARVRNAWQKLSDVEDEVRAFALFANVVPVDAIEEVEGYFQKLGTPDDKHGRVFSDSPWQEANAFVTRFVRERKQGKYTKQEAALVEFALDVFALKEDVARIVAFSAQKPEPEEEPEEDAESES